MEEVVKMLKHTAVTQIRSQLHGLGFEVEVRVGRQLHTCAGGVKREQTAQ